MSWASGRVLRAWSAVVAFQSANLPVARPALTWDILGHIRDTAKEACIHSKRGLYTPWARRRTTDRRRSRISVLL